MHCYICDKILSEKEIQLDPQTLKTEPCLECTEIIYEAAYTGQFSHREEMLEAFDSLDNCVLDDFDIFEDWD